MTESFTDQQPAVTLLRRRRKWAIVALAAFGILVALGFEFVRLVKDAREAAHASQCLGHFKQLVMALHNYHDEFKCFPPAYTTDADGRPMHSWRALILPWLDNGEVSSRINFSKPWNGPENLQLGGQINLDLFHCPSEPGHGRSQMTNYVVVVGDQTAFPGHRTTTLTDITDGIENTILLVEIANSDIHWMEPRDLDFDAMSFGLNHSARPSVSSPHPRGPGVSFTNGRGVRLAKSLRPQTLQALLTIAGGEPVMRDSLDLPNDGHGGQLGEHSARPHRLAW